MNENNGNLEEIKNILKLFSIGIGIYLILSGLHII